MSKKQGNYVAPKFTPPPNKAPAAPKVKPFGNPVPPRVRVAAGNPDATLVGHRQVP
jgi:hypothetical protein